MTELVAAEKTTETPTDSAAPGRYPPAARAPKPLQAIGFALARRWVVRQIARRQGNVFSLKLPIFGPTV
ncbi:cytochrome P450, partial [Mycolicibacterium farcinogenes]|nr:cytochrome P450 [Mycolicibacterium farcinogenes]